MKRMAIFGGTFNPIHNGHIYLIRAFADLLNTDRVFTVVTNVPPHKQHSDLARNEQRLEMCRLAREDEPRIEPCDIELRRAGKSYTCDTLRELQEQNPDAELYFLMGADMFLTLKHWRNPEEIFRYATICASPRDQRGVDELRECAKQLHSMGARTIIEAMTPPEISSTEIRERVARGDSLEGLVPRAVEQYILKNGLYRERSGNEA
jgi:nicotinate-nucleotide adenylyltransferase